MTGNIKKTTIIPPIKTGTDWQQNPASDVSFRHILQNTKPFIASKNGQAKSLCQALNSAGFACHGRQWLQSLVTPEQGEDLARDNFLCFAPRYRQGLAMLIPVKIQRMELMKLVLPNKDH